MAYGVLGLTPEEFGEMTLKQFYAKIEGFGWKMKIAARGRAEIIAAISNSSPNRRKGTGAATADRLCPITNPPRNIFFRQLFGLPW